MHFPTGILGWLIALFSVLLLVIDVDAHNLALGPSKNTGHSEDIASNFWERAASMGVAVQKYAEQALDDATVTYASAASRIEDVELSMTHLIERTEAMKASIVEQHGKSVDDLYDLLAAEMGKLAQEIKEAFPPPDHAENHAERQLVMAKILTKVNDGVIRAVVAAGIPEDEAKVHFEAMEPHILNILVTTGDLLEQHPTLALALLFSVVDMVVPQSWILRPIFGLFGFGPAGTLKGSIAAWAQSRFFGAYIPAGSWFSKLQSASMG
ncbi:hypothetical protein FIBSPDRAFT_877026 [Athelia psychrophila]|uniref:Uncharacterized protein n=1 Tax=Athelia psychrophila TaxID=1759441 RepID=A0A167WBD7_9AGAM|nr:hypothetical protein FIBSPDRAFT_877026 [Fibularhizoctonia sp. CBS 109695]